MAKKGITPSQIGVILRDSHGIAQGFKDYLTAKMLFIFARAYSLKCFKLSECSVQQFLRKFPKR